MIPLRDENPTRRFPWMTILLIVVNVVVFGYEWSLGSAELQAFITSWAFIPARFLSDPTSPREISTLVSAMFMHAGPIHLAGNMLYLWIFGNNIEDRVGPPLYLLFYLACGVVATAAQTAAGPDATIPTLGASGAVAGILGAYALLYPRAGVITIIPIFFFFEVARLPALLVIGFWFVLQVANGVVSLAPEALAGGGVAWFAHIGGFAAGLVLALPALRNMRRRAWR